MKKALAFLWGGIFALGLMILDMINPHTVHSFLDIFGHWNARLAFVMIGAILVAIIPFQLVKHHKINNTWFNEKIHLPTGQQIDRKLLLGATLFGIGWGISGICPAPVLALLSLGYMQAIYFIIAMLFGMWLCDKTVK
ncbi:DUF6691 family protein [Acinetobacter rathckeae]|uniref:DUF6691 family protein n=1 Tax=Acinetobacter rathckeae TaxID=2605272 RepID=UPI0018A27AF1|nr:DUF6691 family protein [Acinetobacter rathckeae]MBF7688940.1 YeeE/YedE family protein [Acinetobacter rathckeae]MBF7696339.1 YeeE/YedE family protein [Acinetobacter rathckeae]